VIPKGRSNVWWELHRYEPGQQWFSPEYCQFLKAHPKVMVAEPTPEIPNGEVLPVDELVAKYSPYFFTSSIAWMMAVAIEMGATKIGLWGVDMAATEEYEAQRAGLHYFALIARQRGIEVGVPPESDLFRPRFLYGIDEIKHSHIKLRARRQELLARKADAEHRFEAAKQEVNFITGAIDDLTYMHMTWADGGSYVEPPLISAPIIKPEVQRIEQLSVPLQAETNAIAEKRRKPRKPKGNGADPNMDPVRIATASEHHVKAGKDVASQ
jgi:hypothetical protein